MNALQESTDHTIVIGGGLAGLGTAAFLTRAGRAVTVFEKTRELGGRAATQKRGGFSFNLGPHGIYSNGPTMSILRELHIPFGGGVARIDKAYVVRDGRLHRFPVSASTLLQTRLLGLRTKAAFTRWFAALERIDLHAIQHVSWREWLDREIGDADLRAFVEMLSRLMSYANDPERASAGAMLQQMRYAIKRDAFYVDGGWQTLIDGLRHVIEASGGRVETNSPVVSIERQDDMAYGVRLSNGAYHAATTIVTTGSPHDVSKLIQDQRLRAWAESAVPVRMATLDLALSDLPQPDQLVALGIDRPLYLSVHSASAKLAPEGGAMIHVAKYLRSDDDADATSIRHELEELLDQVQPGWRAVTVDARFLPHMIVNNALVTTEIGSRAARPGPRVAGLRNVLIAGDWVGPEGWLSDASLSSAKQAALLVLEQASIAQTNSFERVLA